MLEPEQYVFGHHADYDSLLRSKEKGCIACKEFNHLNDRDDENDIFKALGYYSVFTVELSRTDVPRPMMSVFSGEVLEQFLHEMVPYDGKSYLSSVHLTKHVLM